MFKMFSKVYDHRLSDSWASNLRKQRLALFASKLESLPSPIKILDVGGTVNFWENIELLNTNLKDLEITVMNLSYNKMGSTHPNIQQVIGDARNMEQFQSNQFDVVFSNSVIEHVGDDHDQQQMATEIMRVGKRYFVQTPNLFFPIEPHFVFPFFQFLPINVRVWLISNFALGWFSKFTDQEKARKIVTSTRLLSKKKLLNFFPGSEFYEEKFFGLIKSLIVYQEFQKTSNSGE
ncbi:class I SAM-dependent methyltransferase [Nostoc sp. WHI]|uniref:class I SAM-dependent methyltransferase n=1 Tax=Nostoc sp. WHI TaxID=2650611 RepID=UPI0018C6F621|nr:class I SAM-dependent methyltransferase [Nostoc sp. WHI]MBG1266808.1 class I SAM-dependent methyltransferase [Nostoc sp. WHI]